MKKFFIVWILFFYSLAAFAQTEANSSPIIQVGQQWEKALESRDANKISALYSPEAILYPTFESIKTTPQEILAYFQKLTQNTDLKVVFNQQHVQLHGDIAINSGFYTFSYREGSKKIIVPARYTFVYWREKNHWMIINHHSSVMPSN